MAVLKISNNSLKKKLLLTAMATIGGFGIGVFTHQAPHVSAANITNMPKTTSVGNNSVGTSQNQTANTSQPSTAVQSQNTSKVQAPQNNNSQNQSSNTNDTIGTVNSGFGSSLKGAEVHNSTVSKIMCNHSVIPWIIN